MVTNVSNAQTSAWDVLNVGAPLDLVDRGATTTITRPAGGESTWLAIRTDAGWDRSSAAYAGRSLHVAVPALLEMKEQRLLGWEAYLVAAHVRLGNIDARVAAEWVALFTGADAISDDAFIQRLFRLRQYDRGSALAVYPPECVPADLNVLSAAEVLASIETAIPARRTLDMSETVRVPGEVVATLDASEDSSFVQAVAYALNGASFSGRIWPNNTRKGEIEAGQPSLGSAPSEATEDYRASNDSSAEGRRSRRSTGRAAISDEAADDKASPNQAAACDASDVALIAELGWLTRHRWNRLQPRIEEISSAGWIPSKLYWRAVVHQYLQANQDAVSTLSELYSEAYAESSSGNRFMGALSDLVDGTIHADPASWPRRAEATNTTWLWVYAEHLRFRWQLEDAADLAAILIDQDAQFLGSWLTQTAIALRRGDMETVRTNLDHLTEASPPNSVYAHWTMQLGQQLAGDPVVREE